MNYPLALRFKKISLTNEMRVVDNQGQELAYVRQKLFKFKEEINVYADRTKQQTLYTIKADKVIDWSPTYTLYNTASKPVASMKREGARSLFNSTYILSESDLQVGILKEQNPWVKFLDSIVGSIPIIEFFSGYVINPKYELRDHENQLIATVIKKPALFEGHYSIEDGLMSSFTDEEQMHVALLLMVIAMLERYRG